jgi:hypothetical protein
MDKLIEVANQAVADYGFRQAVMYGADHIGRQAGLSENEQKILEGPVLEFLATLPIPVQPADIPGEQAKMTEVIRAAA